MVDKPPEIPTPAEVKRRWQLCVDDMLNVRRNFWLNEAFFHGEQWLAYNDKAHELQVLEFRTQEEAKIRATVNKFKPRTVQYISRMVRTPLEFEPRPEGVDAEDLRRNRISEQVLYSEAHRADWEQVRHDAIMYAMFGGVSAVCIEPDWQYQSAPAPDASTGELIALPTRPAPRLTALTAPEFGIEPGSRNVRDARWWIKCTTLTPEQAKDFYQLDYLPLADSSTSMSATHRMLIGSQRMDRSAKVCLVYVLYERPSGKIPGWVIHVVGNKIVRQYEWPFPWSDELNLWPFVQTKMAGTWKGDTFLNDVRQIQVNYNRAYTTVNAHLGKADNARLIVPAGAVMEGDDEFTGEVGEIIRVNPDSQFPQWMQAPQIPRWLREHVANLEEELDDAFSAHSMSPGTRNSGMALSIIAEKDDTPLGIFSANQQRGWQKLAEWVLRLNRHMMLLAAQHPDRPVQLQVSDVIESKNGDAVKIEWSAADLPEHPIVHVPMDSVMPRSQAAIQSMMVQLAGSFPAMFQSLSPAQLAVMLQTPDPNAFARVADDQLQEADWENGRMTVGAGDEEVVIADWQDHTKHKQRHNALRASSAYREASPQVRQYIDLHVAAHERLEQEQMMKDAQKQAQLQAAAAPPGPMPGGPPPGPPDPNAGGAMPPDPNSQGGMPPQDPNAQMGPPQGGPPGQGAPPDMAAIMQQLQMQQPPAQQGQQPQTGGITG